MLHVKVSSGSDFLKNIIDGLVRRFIRDEKGVHFDKPSPSFELKDFVPIEVKAGTLVVIHGDLIHQRCVAYIEGKIIFLLCCILFLHHLLMVFFLQF